MSKIYTLIFLIVFALSLIYAENSLQPVEAIKSSGTKIPLINSKNICGIELCATPTSIAEKIQSYLESLVLTTDSDKFHIGGVMQQGLSTLNSATVKSTPNAITSKNTVSSTKDAKVGVYRDDIASKMMKLSPQESNRLGGNHLPPGALYKCPPATGECVLWAEAAGTCFYQCKGNFEP